MLDKMKIKEYIENNSNWGDYEGELFYIIPSWNLIKQVNKLQGVGYYSDTRICYSCKRNLDTSGCGSNNLGEHYSPYYTPSDVLEFSNILAWIDSDYPFPITQDDLTAIEQALYYQGLLERGQMTFDGYSFEWGFEFSPEIARQILVWYAENDNDLLDLNDRIKDEIGEIEWGFDDEYSTCDSCGDVLRTSPDSYDWTPEYYETENGERFCEECSQKYSNDAIEEIQHAIDNGDSPKSYNWIFDLSEEWQQVKHPYYAHSKWENGLHHGQNDSPLKQGKIVRFVKHNDTSLFQIVFRVYPSQFTVEWDAFIRVNPDLDTQEVTVNLDEWLAYFGEKFASPEGRTKYDNATLLQQALKSSKGQFNKITWDSDEGTIDSQSYDNLNDFLNS